MSKGRRLEVFTAAVLLTMVSFAFFYHVHEGQIDMIVAALSDQRFLLYPRWRGWPSAALLARRRGDQGLADPAGRGDRPVLPRLALPAQGAGVRAGHLPRLPGVRRCGALPRVRDPDPPDDRRVRLVAVQPDAAALLVEVPDRRQDRLLVGYAALLFLAWVAGRNSRRVADSERRVDLRTERNSVLLLAVVLMLLFSPLAWQMAYVWVIVPLALVLTAAPPRGKEWAVLVLAVAAALLSMRMWPYRVLDMTNMIGAAVAAVCLMLYYLPFDLERLRAADMGSEPPAGSPAAVEAASGAAADAPAAAEALEAEVPAAGETTTRG